MDLNQYDNQNTLQKWINIIVIGGVAGKTSLIDAIIDSTLEKNPPKTQWRDFRQTKIKINNKTIRLRIWDTPGADKYKNFLSLYVRMKVQGIIINYDITKPYSYQCAISWQNQIKKNHKDNEVVVFLVGTHLDLQQNRKVQSKKAAGDFNMQQGVDFWQVSNKTGQNIDRMISAFTKTIWLRFKDRINDTTQKVSKEQDQQNQYRNQNAFYQEELRSVEGYGFLLSTVLKSIGAITSKNSKKQFCVGSGVLLSERVVLTAANCIYDKKYGRYNTDITFHQRSYYEQYISLSVQKCLVPQQYKQNTGNNQFQFDYALLFLNNDKREQKEYLQEIVDIENYAYPSIHYPCEMCLGHPKVPIELYGYPIYGKNYKNIGKSVRLNLQLYGLSRRDALISYDLKNGKISFGMRTKAGQNGCPILVDRSVAAIYIGNNIMNQKCCQGRIITLDMLEQLQKWTKPNTLNIRYCQHAKLEIKT